MNEFSQLDFLITPQVWCMIWNREGRAAAACVCLSRGLILGPGPVLCRLCLFSSVFAWASSRCATFHLSEWIAGKWTRHLLISGVHHQMYSVFQNYRYFICFVYSCFHIQALRVNCEQNSAAIKLQPQYWMWLGEFQTPHSYDLLTCTNTDHKRGQPGQPAQWHYCALIQLCPCHLSIILLPGKLIVLPGPLITSLPHVQLLLLLTLLCLWANANYSNSLDVSIISSGASWAPWRGMQADGSRASARPL